MGASEPEPREAIGQAAEPFRQRWAACTGSRLLLLLWSERIEVHLDAVLELPAGQAIDRRRGFFELGITSAQLVEVARRLEIDLGRSLPATELLEYPSVIELARRLAQFAPPEADGAPRSS